MLVKIRRHVFNPVIARLKIKEVLCIISIAGFLAYLYTSVPSTNQENEGVYYGNRRSTIQSSSHTALTKLSEVSSDFVAAVLVICSMRPDAIKNHLEQLRRLRPSSTQFPIVISQDGSHEVVRENVMLYVNQSDHVMFMRHERETPKRGKNYQYIAEHYKWALNLLFMEMKFEYVIITEDDLDIADDFFSYFTWAKRILEKDPTVWCASAWNDNGIPKLVDRERSEKIWRTDFFPGLGWMLSRTLWAELSPQFPSIYWDDWMRTPQVRKNRSCIRPELPRTAHNMKLAGKGSSGGLYKSFLSSIARSEKPVDFSLLPIEGMLKEKYDADLQKTLQETRLVTLEEFPNITWNRTYSYRVVFNTVRAWYYLAEKIGIMIDIRGGMQRTSYYGVVPVFHHGCRLYLIPRTLDLNNMVTFTYDPIWDKQYKYLEFAKTYCKQSLWTGKCDPHSEEMIAWFKRKNWMKRLQGWGEMVLV